MCESRTTQGSCLLWLLERRSRVCFLMTSPVSSLVCGLTEECRTASPAPENTNSTTRPHSEPTHTHQARHISVYVVEKFSLFSSHRRGVVMSLPHRGRRLHRRNTYLFIFGPALPEIAFPLGSLHPENGPNYGPSRRRSHSSVQLSTDTVAALMRLKYIIHLFDMIVI